MTIRIADSHIIVYWNNIYAMKHLENYIGFNGYYVEPLIDRQIGV